jgi:hypothetical protein
VSLTRMGFGQRRVSNNGYSNRKPVERPESHK